MLEVELKFAIDDPAALADRLRPWTELPTRTDEDHYFNAPDRDFARTDEAFRVRTIGPKNVLTYKGPKIDVATKSRFELELPLADGPESARQWRELLTRLDYRPAGVVRKSRRPFSTRRDGFELQATIDTVEQLGQYAEVEIMAPEADFERAKATLLQVADELGLKNPERRSYLGLLLKKTATPPAPQVIEPVDELRQRVRAAQRRGQRVGFVPTMGALHEGHAALMRAARAECDLVVVSIFVNPTQFGPNEDFARYPRTLEADRAVCESAGVDVIFVPAVETVYPMQFATVIDPGPLATVYEGASRPGHFRGVATVVCKLFNMVQPDVAYFGQKDAQQVAVIKSLVRDFDMPIRLSIQPTVREPDGLALSSRNRYLDATLRSQAPALHRALQAAKAAWQIGDRDPARLHAAMAGEMTPAFALDYAAVVDADSFGVPSLGGRALAVIAARLGTTRLIDNLPLTDD